MQLVLFSRQQNCCMTLGENVPTDKKTLHLASYKLDVSFLLVHIHAISSPKVLAGRASTA